MIIQTSEQMEQLGETIGAKLRGGEVIELVGDVGVGKTTFTRGLARGLGITDNITSPSFTISCNYTGRDNLTLRHYDFYRLNDAGIIAMEIAEGINTPNSITIVEWADNIRDILPTERVAINISYLPTSGRNVQISTTENLSYLQP
ncbi:MAG: tRNA (adenosine(37)-N6)-threonylcarbamoyltransferase complex ATPase subunit type 1 TsaE [Candidatus Saccharibacteria bacterium]|nr:tRNA (adenosine(37)-N6)-threonylcarbamoyltransferase complex ATPase subunit type 1 TsaE [Candidatus Saccharibacteria bacterium]